MLTIKPSGKIIIQMNKINKYRWAIFHKITISVSEMHKMIKEQYISLKEAAKISGYTTDYLGQLIRKGKIPGKQVYCNIAWMTTEEGLREYMEKNSGKNGSQTNLSLKERVVEKIRQAKIKFFEHKKPSDWFRMALYFVVAASLLFSFLLFYIFSVNLEKKLEQSAIKKATSDIEAVQ